MKYIYFILITLFISFQGLSQSSVVWLSYHKPMKGKGSELFDAIKDKTQKLEYLAFPEAIIKIFEKGKIGNFYNIGSNFNINNLKVTKMLLRCLKKKIKIPILSMPEQAYLYTKKTIRQLTF